MNKELKIFIASDHAGFEYKSRIIEMLKNDGYEVRDFGAFEYNEADDYPDFITPLAKAISEANNDNIRGIILGGSGQGEAIDANRFEGVRAIEYYGGDIKIITQGREHNNANVLSLGARFATLDEVNDAVKTFLETPFSGDERHIRRINEIDE